MSILKNIIPRKQSTDGHSDVSFFRKVSSSIAPTLKTATTASSYCEEQRQAFDSDLFVRREDILNGEQLRLVIIAETNRLLFDSKTILPVHKFDRIDTNITKNSRTSQCAKFKLLRHEHDVVALGLMLFGSLPMMRRATFKLHHLKCSQQIMFGNIMSLPKTNKQACSDFKVNGVSGSSDSPSPSSTIHSYNCSRTNRDRKTSQTLDPPQSFSRIRNSSFQSDSETWFDGSRLTSPRHLSRRRRLQHSSRLGELSDDGAFNQCNRRFSSCSSTNENNGKRIAVGIIFNESHRRFLLQHITLIEAEMNKLRAQIMNATLSKTKFFEIIYEGWTEMVRNICLLYNAPRFHSPVWLSLVRSREFDQEEAETFCSNLASLLKLLDLKTTGFFFSNLLSCVLMNHLSWVASATRRSRRKTDSEISSFFGVCESNLYGVYDIHTAQHLELCGNINGVVRSARTLIIGENAKIISQLIYVLTYFIRCSEIHRSEKAGANILLNDMKEFSDEGNFSFMSSPNEADERIATSCDKVLSVNIPCADEQWQLPSPDSIRSYIDESDSDLAHSLFAGVCDSYCAYFVLSGLQRSCLDSETYSFICNFVKNGEYDAVSSVSTTSSESLSSPGSPHVAPTVIVIADINDFTVKAISGNESYVDENQMNSPCEMIVTMLEQFGAFHEMGASHSLLLALIENTLRDIHGKSLSLIELLNDRCGDYEESEFTMDMDMADKDTSKANNYSSERIVSVIGCDCSDLRLILNVAAVYYPGVLRLASC